MDNNKNLQSIIIMFLVICLPVFTVNTAYSQTYNYGTPVSVKQLPQLDYNVEDYQNDLPPQNSSQDNYYQSDNSYSNQYKSQDYYPQDNLYNQSPDENSYNQDNYVYKDSNTLGQYQNYNSQPYSSYNNTYPQSNYSQNTYPQYYNGYNNQYQQSQYSNQYNYPKDHSVLKSKVKSAITYGAMGAAGGALLTGSKNRGKKAAIGAGIGAVLGLLLGR